MKIAIIGTGKMARALARHWHGRGHHVTLGSRSAERGRRIAAQLGVAGTSIAEAAAGGPVVVLAVPWVGVEAVLDAIGGTIAEKIVVDCTNPMVGRRKPLLVGRTTSGAEEIAARASGARVVKAFNAIAVRVLASGDPCFDDRTATIFYCGDDEPAKATAVTLITDCGFRPCDVGPLSAARYLEPLAALSLRIEDRLDEEEELALAPLVRKRLD